MWKDENSQQNALGVGIRAGRTMLLQTAVVKPPLGSGHYEQAGLWWGTDQNFHVKFVITPPTVGTWTTKTPLPAAILDAGGAALGGKLYVVAGKTSTGYRRTLHIYDPASNAWTTGPDLPAAYAAVEKPAVASYGGRLYVFGGCTRNADGTAPNPALASVECFDPATNTWSVKAPMPTGRRSFTVGTLNGRAQITGGESSPLLGTTYAEHEEYDPGTPGEV